MKTVNLRKAHVLVVGDVMLDRYWFGDAERISPEAPVPVVRITKTEDRLGGAANVAVNIASLGAHSELIGIIGADTNGQRLRTLCHEHQIHRSLFEDPSVNTTEKLRIIARQQQMVRCDFESTPDRSLLEKLYQQLPEKLQSVKAVILSDYGKGVLEDIPRIIRRCQTRNIPVFIDPKGDNYARYTGATMITPNKSELRQVIGQWHSEEELYRRAQNLRSKLSLQYLLLTRSEEGMSLFYDQGVVHFSAQAREVYDVSGAGDTVIAVVATMYAVGTPIEQAVEIANQAGGIVVGKLGTATVSYSELFSL